VNPSVLELLPDPDILLEMEPQDIAGYILAYFNMPRENPSPKQYLSCFRFGNTLFSDARDIPPLYHGLQRQQQEAILEALMDAWAWLEREGLLVEKPSNPPVECFVLRRGRGVLNAEDLNTLRHTDLLPRKFLHPRLASKIWAPYLRGDYDVVVFQAFKEVEVAVRKAGKFPATELGVELMRKAFNPEQGPLRDGNQPTAERDALSNLFAGAIVAYKSPQSHRHVVTTAEEAVELVLLANHLLRIVGSRPVEPQAETL
jgi:uncharacterized protein (TIGR02391 family)